MQREQSANATSTLAWSGASRARSNVGCMVPPWQSLVYSRSAEPGSWRRRYRQPVCLAVWSSYSRLPVLTIVERHTFDGVGGGRWLLGWRIAAGCWPGRAALLDDGLDPASGGLRVAQDIRLPEPHDEPAEVRQLSGLLPVALDVAPDLGEPVVRIGPPRQLLAEGVPVAAVPEVAVAEEADARAGEHEVGSARQARGMLAVAQAGPPEGLSQQALGLAAFTAVRLLDTGGGRRGRLETAVGGDFRKHARILAQHGAARQPGASPAGSA